jgi:hypothetical protein
MEDAARQLLQMIMGFRSTQLLYVTAKLGIADLLVSGPRRADELAGQVEAHAGALYRVLRALASMGFVAEGQDGRFGLTAAGELLRSDVPGSLRDVALLYGGPFVWQAYGNMMHSVRTGDSAFQATHGQGFYEFLEQHAEEARVFQGAMNAFSVVERTAILHAYGFGGVSTVVDVGAGGGELLCSLLEAYPDLRGVAFDVAGAETGCLRLFDERGVAARAGFVGGDFFDKLPAGHDAYLMKSVAHNWEDADVRRIYRVCRDAMPDSGRLLVIERVVSDDARGAEAKLFDVNMLVAVGGRERTAEQHAALLGDAGFRVSRMVPTASALTVIEAVLLR